MGQSDLPDAAQRLDTPAIGRDEWVATHEQRTAGERRLKRLYDRTPPALRIASAI